MGTDKSIQSIPQTAGFKRERARGGQRGREGERGRWREKEAGERRVSEWGRVSE